MDKSLTLLTWPDYINPASLSQFRYETGVRVSLEIVPSAVELVERMFRPDPGVDVLVPPDYAVRELQAAGLLWSLDHSRLPNLIHLEPRFRNGRAHDPESRFSVIKDWGTTGFMYRTDRVMGAPATWADFWALAGKYSGRVSVLDSPGEVIGAALKLAGRSYNASGEEAMAVVLEHLLRLKPHLRTIETDYKPLLTSGAVWLALGWNGDALALQAAGVPVRYVLPAEGSQIWEDDWAIASGSAKPDTAHDFLDFMLRPDIAAQEARYTRYATGNRTAFEMLEPELKSDASTYPPGDLVQRLETGLPLGPEESLRRAAVWEAFRG